ncbi:MAG TPA: hypothetical protein VJU84_08575 [Pyrinomonadaceae bacterium]|nr:hypothetical protein [Pyrinomonadaceae bacterium]
MDPVTHEINLVGGYVDESKKRHTRVVFGHRLTAKDLFAADEDPQGQNPTQYQDLLVRASIVEFGTLPMPVPLSVLLDLDSIDREDLIEGNNTFSAISAQGHESEFLADHKVRLGWGFKINDVVYTHVEFGRRITGRDDIEADRAGLGRGLRRTCFLIGKQITRISTADNTASLDGPISVEQFEALQDAADVATLRGAAENWRQSFRLRGAAVSRNGRGADSAHSNEAPQSARGSDSRLADRAT